MRWIITATVATTAYLANPNGPFGGFWRPWAGSVTQVHELFPYFLQLGVAEAIALGYSVSLVVTSFPGKALSPLTLGQTRKGFLCMIWMLGNWWIHDSLHIHYGSDFLPLLFIEYIFHATMMLAAVYLIHLGGKLYRGKRT